MTVPLGAYPVNGGVRFAVRAPDAVAVELCLFNGAEEKRLPMSRSGETYIISVPGIGTGQRYGYRASGAWDPAQGLFFDPTKLLVDPYARHLDGRFIYDAKLAQFGQDTASMVPKARVTGWIAEAALPAPVFKPGGLIYELNVRGFSLKHPDVPPQMQGTVAALAHPSVIAHLQKLKVNAVELMPIVAWVDEWHLPPLGLRNAWGYNPVVPMALDPGLVPGGVPELCATVTALRAAGIGVILDLVFNHTGESDTQGPILSFRGLDNRCYTHDASGNLINDTGTGNTLNAANPAVLQLILESLRHFARCGVDGFRFDLATVLARSPAFDPTAPLFQAIAQDPLLKDRVMIAEPWDIGPGGYQLGHFPQNWLEWNDRYRDDVRRFWRGDLHTTGTLATRMMGSSDIFSGHLTRSVNFIAAHDGFTLADTVSYATKHNDANGEANRDGQNENYSWNNGVEGVTSDVGIRWQRQVDIKALLSTLFASRGTIMLCAGDEFGRTQQGNNNAYAQDNEITWLNWVSRDRNLEDFVAELATARATDIAYDADHFVQAADWYDLVGEALTPANWEAESLSGFEVHIPSDLDTCVIIRVDRSERTVSMRLSKK